MTIDYRIVIGEALSEEQKELVSSIIQNTFSEIDRIYNKWNPDSELSRLNHLPAGKVVALSPELEHFLLLTEKFVYISGFRFDPTIEPIQQLWKSKLALNTIPTDEEIQALLPAIGWQHIHIRSGTFQKDHDATQIDLGAIAKGYAVDLLTERLQANGFPNVFVEWGGEIRTLGSHPEGRPWNVYISRLQDSNPANALAYLSLKNQAIATSGDYLQNWTLNSTTYFHIFNSTTGHPLTRHPSRVSSASVIAPTCMAADVFATSAMTFPNIHSAKQWASDMEELIPDLKFYLFTDSSF